jgi:hypothetical protein
MPHVVEENLSASQTVLEETPGRSLTFLRGVAKNPAIYSSLAAAGFTKDEYQLGWKLLHKAAGYSPEAVAAPARTPAAAAMEELDAWDEDGMRRIRRALGRFHKEQEAYVFAGGLTSSTGPAAVVGVGLLLARLADLKDGKDRKGTRKEDHAALATLASRGFDAGELARLSKLVATAQSVGEPESLREPSTDGLEALSALYDWYKDWSDTARSVVKKRAHLISLGLVKRRSPKKGVADAGEG